MSLWSKFHDFMEHGRPVPPPAAPPPGPGFVPQQFSLYVPFWLQENVRITMRMLGQNSQVSPEMREYVNAWLDEYDAQLMEWLKESYGEGVGALADTITRDVFEQQKKAADEGMQAHVDEAIQNLEEQFRDDDE
ncbi:hypothetical protein Wildcat_72 [Mycobacterium phage Wildcat]|uniref:Uncharacterized protein n=3 Tax=Mycobacterium virus Wildcat TaxID=1993859 RepID=Q19XY8_9CAUD|nr:hypothetical protein Wildcat_72 [Mycobacterium phage Wildcat]ABE67677.1 hypothetical protein Wildcat_72 [Mycobacterium phage Wildcat]AJD82145.1 hypothetical protein COSMO_73 [Mycobacterium phage Cosmo]QGJ89960.1 hypothetical protein PBI_MARYV_72 [Mycobacterium phage MaryV]WKR36083.1 hypothetical protein [Mycobacterium phage Azrael100]